MGIGVEAAKEGSPVDFLSCFDVATVDQLLDGIQVEYEFKQG